MPEDTRSAWGRYAPRFASEGTGATDRPSLRTLVELCAPSVGDLVLDVATGAGFTAFSFALTGARLVALDPTHEMLLATRTGWHQRSLPGDAKVVEAWAEALPFRDGSFDAVVAHRAPHQFADRAAFLRDSRRILRDGGVLGLADQSPPDGWEDWHNDLERLRDPTHDRALSPLQWRGLVEEAGFVWERDAVVHQAHDVEDWLDRVDCPEGRRVEVRSMLEAAGAEVRDAYHLEQRDGRWFMRTPQAVLVARSPG